MYRFNYDERHRVVNTVSLRSYLFIAMLSVIFLYAQNEIYYKTIDFRYALIRDVYGFIFVFHAN